ncbi:hypothetical protein HDU96_005918 [Phlyctochytrium bullatum]|nr:hypothetical protein HDU96_005918 [Phlyctochytrium bullatum]
MRFAVVSAAASLAVLAHVANAHYVLTVPLTRGFDDDAQVNGPCGGYNASVNPVAFPLSTYVEISATHSTGKLTVNLRPAEGTAAFTRLGEFDVSNGAVGPCNPPPYIDRFNVTVPSAFKSGDRAVLQTIFDGPDGRLYQCADVVIGTPATPLPARDDDGFKDIKPDDITAGDACSNPGVASVCPQLQCATRPATVVGSSAAATATSKAPALTNTVAAQTTAPASATATATTKSGAAGSWRGVGVAVVVAAGAAALFA